MAANYKHNNNNGTNNANLSYQQQISQISGQHSMPVTQNPYQTSQLHQISNEHFSSHQFQ
jgi:hypothetical protein